VIFNPEGAIGPMYASAHRVRRRFWPASPIADPAPVRAAVPAPVPRPTPVVRPSSAGTALEVQGLSVHYGGVIAVDDVSFTVAEGDIVGLIGPNGAGKTTLIDALSGFTRYRGHAALEGQSLDGLPPHRRAARGLGRTFQSIDLYEDLSVEENIMVGQHLARGGGAAQLMDVLDSLGLSALRERNVGELSQGQRQLVSIARALAGEPKVLLLDEPAAGLDSSESAWLAERLRVVRDSGVTILLIDHDMSLVLGLCDHLHVLNFGSMIASGTPDHIRVDPAVVDAYLGATRLKEVAP
jgi:ABC-type branched-subunit amino acid transport system ATPase component